MNGDGTARTLETHIPADRRTLLVGLVDVTLLAGLVLVGTVSHGTSPLSEPLATLETIAPFVIAWVPVAALAGAYAPPTLSSPVDAGRVIAIGWLAAVNVGLILRSSPLFDGGASWPFNLVMTGLGLAILLAWRLGYAAAVGSTRTRQ